MPKPSKESRRVKRFLPTTGNWKPVLGFESRYLVSDQGEIWSLYQSKIARSYPMNSGYIRITLYNGDKYSTGLIHRLVAEVFCNGYAKALNVNHKDGDKHNNCAANLEWVTPRENMKHAVATGLMRDQNGEGNLMTKLTNVKVSEIKKALRAGVDKKVLAELYGVKPQVITDIKRGDTWKRVP
jgi:hypothetical protein